MRYCVLSFIFSLPFNFMLRAKRDLLSYDKFKFKESCYHINISEVYFLKKNLCTGKKVHSFITIIRKYLSTQVKTKELYNEVAL